ncbi:MAG: TolC family protein, partial [Planctomycetes bacterium]|nr:TolC family protein [Planctomycetota bacterium]
MIRLTHGRMLLLVAFAAGLRPAAAQDVKTYTLDEVQRLAAGYYQAVGIARAQAEQARLGERMAYSARLPMITSQGVLTRNVVTGSLTFNDIKIDILPAFDYTVTLAAVQPLYAGHRLRTGQRQAELAVAAATTGLGITVQDTVLAATKAFYGVLGAQENVEISRRAVTLAQQTLRTADSLFRAGDAVETSVLRAQVAENETKRELLLAENTLVLARQQLMLFTGVTGEFQVARPPAARAVDTPVDDLVAQGLAARPELKALALQRQIAGLEIEKRRGEWLPTIQAEAVYQKRKATFPSSQLASVAVNAVWPVFDGGRRGAAVASARSALKETELQEELVRRQTAEQIRAAHVAMQMLGASVDLLRIQVELARRNADETGKAYK